MLDLDLSDLAERLQPVRTVAGWIAANWPYLLCGLFSLYVIWEAIR